MFEPRISMELSQHMFELQMGKSLYYCIRIPTYHTISTLYATCVADSTLPPTHRTRRTHRTCRTPYQASKFNCARKAGTDARAALIGDSSTASNY